MSVDNSMVNQLVCGAPETAPALSLSANVSDTYIGELLVQSGALGREQIPKILALQRQEHLRFGDAALRLGLIRVPDIDRALARQFDFPILRPGDASLCPELVAAHEPMGAHAEALRVIRAQLVLRWFKDQSRALAVIGARARAGASQLAANLAVTFAQLGENTLLIDANFRNPSQHRLFGLGAESGPGLSNVLANRGSINDCVRPIEAFGNLSLLCAGSPPPNPQELLGRLGFAYIVKTTLSPFDVVIIDTPPALDFADAQLIAALAGGCVLATRRNEARIDDIRRTKAQIDATGAAVLGAVLCG